jgi:hypothetical protein
MSLQPLLQNIVPEKFYFCISLAKQRMIATMFTKQRIFVPNIGAKIGIPS